MGLDYVPGRSTSPTLAELNVLCKRSAQTDHSTRPAIDSSINFLTATSRFRAACVSCQQCASAIALPYLAICCCLFICCYHAVRGYVTPCHLASCIRSISCSNMHDNPHDACPSVLCPHCTHAHACTARLACIHCVTCMHALCALITCLRACILSTACIHAYIRTYKHTHTQALYARPTQRSFKFNALPG